MIIMNAAEGKIPKPSKLKALSTGSVLGITFGVYHDPHNLIREAGVNQQCIRAEILSLASDERHMCVSLIPLYGGGKATEFALYNKKGKWFCAANYKKRNSIFKDALEFEVRAIILEKAPDSVSIH